MAYVLVIDDDREVRHALVRLLTRLGHEVVDAENGKVALKRFAERPADLVITDINMPEMDGIEVITTFAEQHPGVRVIAISGGGRIPKELLLSSAGMLGAVVTVAKPFDIAQIRDAVDRALSDSGDTESGRP